jgi:hypothetical protein
MVDGPGEISSSPVNTLLRSIRQQDSASCQDGRSMSSRALIRSRIPGQREFTSNPEGVFDDSDSNQLSRRNIYLGGQ